MLIRPRAISLSLALSLLTACDAWPGSVSKPKIDMTGIWTFRDGPITTSYLLRADGTYKKSYSLPAHIPAPPEQTGTWFFGDDSMLHVKVLGTLDIESGNLLPVTIQGNAISFADSTPHSIFTRQ